MAAGGFKEFVAGETLDQDEINDYLMQGMLVFAGTAARGSAIGTPVEGQFSYLADTDAVEFYDGSAWVEFSSGAGAAVVSGTTGSPTVTSGTTIGGTAYDIYEFTGDGSITFSDPGLIDLFIVGGGAGGGGVNSTDNCGGGGGGGLFTEISSYYTTAGTVTIAIGAGATGGTSENRSVSEGSFFGPVESPGGGYGMSSVRSAFDRGGDGPSGGGGGSGVDTFQMPGGKAQVQTNGNDGGQGRGSSTANQRAGGGGGGAGAVGADAASFSGGNGGAGLSTSITGSAVFYSAGGGGGARTGSAGTGGSSIGGAGGLGNTAGSNASPANRGAGGGGSGGGSTAGGNGSSGVVIVRVAV